MLRGMYTAAGGMETAARNQDIVADNLSHATTSGYRRQGLLFEVPAYSLINSSQESASRNAIRAPEVGSYTHFEPGPLERTQNPLDVAIVGDAFFVVDGPNGPLYTRNGGFELNASGQLQTRGGGYLVRGQGGPITMPANATQITVGSDGTISANGAEVGRLDLASFSRPDELQRVGGTLFEGGARETPAPGSVRVEQGYREGSNVQAVQEMISMMLGMRYYESAEKAVRAISDAISLNTRPQAG